METIKKLKNPASIIGAMLLIFLGGYIAMSTQMSIGRKDKPAKELSATTRISIGVAILLVGIVIMITHFKKQE